MTTIHRHHNSVQVQPLSESEALEMRVALYCLRVLLAQKSLFKNLAIRGADDLAFALGRFMRWTSAMRKKVADQIGDLEMQELKEGIFIGSGNEPPADVNFSAEQVEVAIRALAKGDCNLLLKELGRLHHTLESQIALLERPHANVRLLAEAITLSKAEQKLLDHTGMVHRSPAYARVMRMFGNLAFDQACRLLGLMLKEDEIDIRCSLAKKSPLLAYAFIDLRDRRPDMEDFISLDENGMMLFRESFTDEHALMAKLVQPSKVSTLARDDYPHMADSLAGVLTYLSESAASKRTGVNILLYGEPGTGKTELARLISSELGWDAYEVENSDEDGDPLKGHARFGRYAMAQQFLSERPQSLLIFDEVEDVFPSDGGNMLAALFGIKHKGKAEAGKAWVNDLLESSPVPSIWISNEISQIDPAYLRRFQAVLEVPNPPLNVRSKMVARALDGLIIEEGLLEELAQDKAMTPAVLNTVVTYARTVAGSDPQKLASTLRQSIAQRRRAMGLSDAIPALRTHPTKVSLEYLNLVGKTPIEKIVNGLERNPQATLCLYGAPGTGKTTLAEYVAKKLGKPLLIKRASDLFDKYVGETEKRISAMFQEAHIEKAVLFLDEADTFLRSRKEAVRSWEVSRTNELLQQMERFDGIFICATNLFEGMDEAALRRFSYKLKFDFLRPEQREALFIQEALDGNDKQLEPELSRRLAHLEALTPGDFAVVKRQQKLCGELFTADEFLAQLEEECAVKRGKAGGSIGFLG